MRGKLTNFHWLSFGENFTTGQLTDLNTGLTAYQRRGDHGPGLEYDKQNVLSIKIKTGPQQPVSQLVARM